jgi:hypothetical protein
MDPPKVLLERSFLAAVAHPHHTQHDACVATYRVLLDQYEHQEVLLVAVGDHLRALDLDGSDDGTKRAAWFIHRPHKGVFAPVDALYVGFQHRRAARATSAPDATVALTLVMCNRHKVRRVATANPAYERYDLDVLLPTTAAVD